MNSADSSKPSDTEQAIAARWVIPMDGPVLSPGVVRWKGERITSVEEGTDPEAHQLGDMAVLPGLINAHTHLEFSHLEQPIPHRGTFASWIANVVAERMQRTHSSSVSIQRGLDECQNTGTTFVGEIATSDASLDVVSAGILFQELLGLAEDQIDEKLEIAEEFLSARSTSAFTRGLSPHAPYSTHPRLVEGLVELATHAGALVAMHLAESPDEMELLATGTGPLVDLFREMKVWQEGAIRLGIRPIEYLETLSSVPRSLIIHGTFLDANEQMFLADRRDSMSLVYCPRTTAYFRFRDHPWREMLAQGVRVVIGTDSRASNPDLNILAELRFLREKTTDLSLLELLKMITCDAAAALGIENDAGENLAWQARNADHDHSARSIG